MARNIWSVTNNCFVILDRFLSLDFPNNPKNQNFEKLKKAPGDIIILHMCSINETHMMYGSWDIERDRQILLSFWTIFCLFTPNNPKSQNFETKKKLQGDIIISHKCTKNHDHMLYCSWDMARDDVIVIYRFGPFFAILPL